MQKNDIYNNISKMFMYIIVLNFHGIREHVYGLPRHLRRDISYVHFRTFCIMGIKMFRKKTHVYSVISNITKIYIKYIIDCSIT